jgi:hypothetical protein
MFSIALNSKSVGNKKNLFKYFCTVVYHFSIAAYFIWSCHVHHANISLLLHSLDPVNEEPKLEIQA